MVDEQGNFRRKLMGGFDQEDVIGYIEELSFQRNKYQLEAVQRSHEAGELRAQVEALSRRAGDKDAELVRVNQELSACRAELEELRRDIRVTQDELNAVKNQLDRANREAARAQKQCSSVTDGAAGIIDDLRRELETKLSGMKAALDSAGGKLSELKKTVE